MADEIAEMLDANDTNKIESLCKKNKAYEKAKTIIDEVQNKDDDLKNMFNRLKEVYKPLFEAK